MRIGIDLIALQTESRGRGIGRSCRDLVRALLDLPDAGEIILYSYDGLPGDPVAEFPDAKHRVLAGDPRRVSSAIDDLARRNPDRLDALLVLSPFEKAHGYRPPGKWPGSPRMVAVIHDLIPLVFPEHYLWKERAARQYFGAAQVLLQFDGYLTNSESTRADLCRFFGIRPERARTVGWACDPQSFSASCPGSAEPLDGLGIHGPFLLCVAGTDYRKNVPLLIDAYAVARRSFAERLPLLIVCAGAEALREAVMQRAASRALGDDLILLDGVDDRELADLYRRCLAFVFPSAYEGFGLPILEAMSCGAAVVAARNSSQEEVLGEAGMYFDRLEIPDVAAALVAIARDPARRRTIRRACLERSGAFRWGDCARRARDAFEALVASPSVPAIDPRIFRAGPRAEFRLTPAGATAETLDRAKQEIEVSLERRGVDLYCRGELPPSLFPLRIPARVYDARLESRRWHGPLREIPVDRLEADDDR